MSTNIPASPIPQPTPKIGTRYIAVSRKGVERFGASLAYAHLGDVPDGECDVYALLDPADAAELERLRKVEDEAADAMFAVWTDFTIYLDSPVTMAFCEARAARIAFEKKLTIN